MSTTQPEQATSPIAGLAKDFIQVVREKCGKELDVSVDSIAELDEVVKIWQGLSHTDKLNLQDGMSFFLGEVIRRNLGGHWVYPKWKNRRGADTQCHLSKVAGVFK